MKASETVKNYESERRMYANYVLRGIKKLCKETGARGAGTEQEFKAQQIMAEDLKETCNDVKTEEFYSHPAAYSGCVRFISVCAIVSAVLLLLTHFLPALAVPFLAVGAVLPVIALFFGISEFVIYGGAFDAFSAKKLSHNVIAVRKPSGEVKRRIILSGHADSSPEWRFIRMGGKKLMTSVVAIGIVGAAAAMIMNIITLVMVLGGTNTADSNVIFVFSIVPVCFTPVFIFCMFFFDNKNTVEGASDDLTGCFCAMAIPRYLNDHGINLENTEITVVCTGSSEAGFAGIKSFCKAHAKEFSDVETLFIGIDALKSAEHIAIYNKDIKNNTEASGLLKKGASVAGYDLPCAKGLSDAVFASKSGINATCLAAKNDTSRDLHTRLDTVENMDLKAIEAGVDIVLNTVLAYDEN